MNSFQSGITSFQVGMNSFQVMHLFSKNSSRPAWNNILWKFILGTNSIKIFWFLATTLGSQFSKKLFNPRMNSFQYGMNLYLIRMNSFQMVMYSFSDRYSHTACNLATMTLSFFMLALLQDRVFLWHNGFLVLFRTGFMQIHFRHTDGFGTILVINRIGLNISHKYDQHNSSWYHMMVVGSIGISFGLLILSVFVQSSVFTEQNTELNSVKNSVFTDLNTDCSVF